MYNGQIGPGAIPVKDLGVGFSSIERCVGPATGRNSSHLHIVLCGFETPGLEMFGRATSQQGQKKTGTAVHSSLPVGNEDVDNGKDVVCQFPERPKEAKVQRH